MDIRPHWLFLMGPLLTSLAVVGAAVGLDLGFPHAPATVHWIEGSTAAIPGAWLVGRFGRWRRSSLMVTSFRIIERRGIVTREKSEIRLSQIEQVDVVQTLFRHIVGSGQLEVAVRGDDELWVFEDVRKPVILRRVINRRLGPPPAPMGPPPAPMGPPPAPMGPPRPAPMGPPPPAPMGPRGMSR